MKAKKPIQTKFRMPLLNWVALKPNQITGTVFTELNDEKVLQVSVALPCCQCGHRRRRGPSWIMLGMGGGHLLYPFYREGHGGPGMGVKPNWFSASSRQCVLIPLEAFPASL